jgi:hypothetical protein
LILPLTIVSTYKVKVRTALTLAAKNMILSRKPSVKQCISALAVSEEEAAKKSWKCKTHWFTYLPTSGSGTNSSHTAAAVGE